MTLDALKSDNLQTLKLATIKAKSDLQQPQVYCSVKHHKFLLSISIRMKNNLVKKKPK